MNRACTLTQGPTGVPFEDLRVARALTVIIAFALQSAGVYAAITMLGPSIAFGLYAVGGLTPLLQFHVVRRIT